MFYRDLERMQLYEVEKKNVSVGPCAVLRASSGLPALMVANLFANEILPFVLLDDCTNNSKHPGIEVVINLRHHHASPSPIRRTHQSDCLIET